MTLEEEITHCEEVAEQNEKICERIPDHCAEAYHCASEHRQLAEWLRELKGLRIAVYKLSRIPYGEHLTYKADDVWELFGTYFAHFEEEVMDYEEEDADE